MRAHNTKRTISRTFLLLSSILIVCCVATFLYWAKLHDKFGLSGFSRIQLEQCREPLFIVPKQLSIGTSSIQNPKVISSDELGFRMTIPGDWVRNDSCREEYCVNNPNIQFHGYGKNGAAIGITSYSRHASMPDHSGKPVTNITGFLKRVYGCSYGTLGIHPVVIHTVAYPDYTTKYYYIETPQLFYEVGVTVLSPEYKTLSDEIVGSLEFYTGAPTFIGSMDAYTGVPSPQVPYHGIEFQDIDIYSHSVIRGGVFKTIQAYSESFAAYTFVAFKGDVVTFTVRKPISLDGIDATVELYSYGPTVLRHESNLEMRVPVAGRYFLVLKHPGKKETPFDLHIRIRR